MTLRGLGWTDVGHTLADCRDIAARYGLEMASTDSPIRLRSGDRDGLEVLFYSPVKKLYGCAFAYLEAPYSEFLGEVEAMARSLRDHDGTLRIGSVLEGAKCSKCDGALFVSAMYGTAAVAFNCSGCRTTVKAV